MREGFLEAVQAVQDATGAEKVNTIGYCIGGTLVAAGLGYMAAKDDTRINAATFFTTQIDFEKAGDLLVYVDDEQVKWIEERMEEKGYLAGSRMADAFNLLRSNDLIWSYVINNYMLGKEPAPFDLYTGTPIQPNAAGVHSSICASVTRQQAAQARWYWTMCVSFKKVKVPVYNLAAREDHIAPLPSVFKVGQFLGGETKLVVSGSGHIAGVVNPPEQRKYKHWTNDAPADNLENWLKTAKEHEGSWWPDWADWITTRSGAKVSAQFQAMENWKLLKMHRAAMCA